LAEAERLQRQLRHQTRERLSAQEDERQKLGRELRNEVGQALLAIDLSLLALKTWANAGTGQLQKEIANAQRLAGQSRRAARL
jgi:signal transduction histidine kinase